MLTTKKSLKINNDLMMLQDTINTARRNGVSEESEEKLLAYREDLFNRRRVVQTEQTREQDVIFEALKKNNNGRKYYI